MIFSNKNIVIFLEILDFHLYLCKQKDIGYDTMHLFMGYDSAKDKKVCDAGFEKANIIINRCAKLYSPELVCG